VRAGSMMLGIGMRSLEKGAEDSTAGPLGKCDDAVDR
jgi:hypothetical protein